MPRHSDVIAGGGSQLTASRAVHAEMADRNVRVLLIEDNPGYAELMRIVFTKVRGMHFDLECVTRLSQGLERLSEGGIDVVLLDLSLPDSRGLDTFFKVRDQAPEVPVIVLTVTDDETLAVKAVQAGAQDYLIKGQVDGNLLVRSIHYAVERHRIQQELRRQTTLKLQSSEARFRDILAKNADGIVIVDKRGMVLFANPAAEDMFGRTAEELLGNSFGYPVVADETRELEILRNGDEILAVEMRVVETEWEDEVVYLASLRDITERKRTEEAVRETNIFLRNILDSSSSVSIISTDLEHNVLFWNTGAENIFGYKAEEVVGRHKIGILYPQDDEETKGAVEQIRSFIVKHKKGMSCEIREVTKDGRKLWINLTSTPRFDENGNITGILGIGEDITREKEAQTVLLEHKEALNRSFFGSAEALSKIIENRDPYTSGHSAGVASLAAAIAVTMGLSDEEVTGVHISGILHDIGKMAVPIDVLAKPGSLTQLELSLIRMHPQEGYHTLKTIDFPWPVAQITLQHHERINGTGYPQGLAGNDIIFGARILVAADVVDAMTHHRPYRPAYSLERAMDELSCGRGGLYDPEVVDACLEVLEERHPLSPQNTQ